MKTFFFNFFIQYQKCLSLVDISTSKMDTLSLIQQLRDYEPALVKKIFDYVFVPCSEDKEGKHKYIRAIPTPRTTSIGREAFLDNKNLKWVIIDDSVETIGYGAFYKCSSLTEITIPNSVENIGVVAFSICTSLASIVIPNSVETIGYGAFLGCSDLTHMTIGDSMETIGSRAFAWCSNLTHLTIPNAVKTIGYAAFYECSSLTTLNIPSHLEEQVKDNMFPKHTNVILRQ